MRVWLLTLGVLMAMGGSALAGPPVAGYSGDVAEGFPAVSSPAVSPLGPADAVPESAGLVLLGAGLIGLAAAVRQRPRRGTH